MATHETPNSPASSSSPDSSDTPGAAGSPARGGTSSEPGTAREQRFSDEPGARQQMGAQQDNRQADDRGQKKSFSTIDRPVRADRSGRGRHRKPEPDDTEASPEESSANSPATSPANTPATSLEPTSANLPASFPAASQAEEQRSQPGKALARTEFAQPMPMRRPRYRHAQLWSTIAGSVASLMMTLDMTIVLVALPNIGRSLELSLSGAQWIVNAYSLAFASLLLGVGSLSDLIGRRSIFILGQLVFVAASIGCMTADSETWLITARAIQGAGGAMVFGSSMPLLSDAFGPGEEKKRTAAIAVFMAAGAAAAALGPLVGGALVEFTAWEWIFAINIPIGLFIIVATFLGVPKDPAKWRREQAAWIAATGGAGAGAGVAGGVLGAASGARDGGGVAGGGVASGSKEEPANLPVPAAAELAVREDVEETPPIDWISLVLASMFLFALNYAMLTGPDDGWGDGKVLIGFGVSLIAVVLLVWIQLVKGDNAMIDVRMFRIPSFSAVTIVAFAARLFSFGMMPYIVLWLSGAVGLSALQVGYVSLALALPMIVFSPVALRLAKFIRVGAVQALGMMVVAGGLLLGLMLKAGSGWQDIIPMYLVVGIGTGLMLPHLMDVAVSVVKPSKTGTATGIANTAFPLGTSFGVAIYGAIITAATTAGLKNLSFSTATLMQAFPGAPLPAGAEVSADGQTVTMDAPQKVMDLAASGQFALIREHAPVFADKALEAYIAGLHHVLIVAAALAVVGAVVAFALIRDKDRWEVRSAKK